MRKRKNKVHKPNGKRGRRYRKEREAKRAVIHKIDKGPTRKIRRARETPLPSLVGIVPLSKCADGVYVRSLILECCHHGLGMMHEDGGMGNEMTQVTLPGKRKSKWCLLPVMDMDGDLTELAKLFFMVELVIFVVHVSSEDEEKLPVEADTCLRLFKSCGVCSFVTVVQSPSPLVKKKISKELQAHFGKETKVFNLINREDCAAMLHHVQPDTLTIPQWKQNRPFLLIEAISREPDLDLDSRLAFQVFVRSAPLSVNQIITIPEMGDFQIERVQDLVNEGIIDPNPDLQEGLIVENIPPEESPMEVTFQDVIQNEKRVVPKGTSEYQAAWVADMEPSSSQASFSGSDLEEIRDTHSNLTGGDGAEMTDSDEVSWSEEMDTQDEGMEDGAEEEEDDEDEKRFPDEVKTPSDQTARSRFRNYRGLKSFRTSPWDAKADLPLNYSRIFEFENFRQAMKKAKIEIVQSHDKTHFPVGSHISLTLKGLTVEHHKILVQRMEDFHQGKRAPLIMVGLMRDETKMSVQHYRVTKNPTYPSSILNKEKFLFLSPFRSFRTCPLFSTDNPQYDKHKMERKMEPDCHIIASTYGPITFPPIPLLAFKLPSSALQSCDLAFTGTLQSCAPERVILKHIVLTGRPSKAQKKNAVVKGMFHNAEDVRWFKPLELWTKRGRSGYIKESLGTKGHMKCQFDGNIQQHDTVCISLYRRVFPVWPQPSVRN